MSKSKSAAINPAMTVKRPLKRRIMDNWQLYVMLLIPVVLTIIYKYIPMYGIQIGLPGANGWALNGSGVFSARRPLAG